MSEDTKPLHLTYTFNMGNNKCQYLTQDKNKRDFQEVFFYGPQLMNEAP